MKTINLRWIYPHYRHDEFVEVSDEVWEVMRQAQREMNNYERRKVYHRAYYSLDAYSWTENYALEHGRSPEEIFLEREERAARLRLLAALPEALAHATPTQARRVRAYYIAGISQPEISRREGVHSSKVSVAIRRGLRNMRRCYEADYFTRHCPPEYSPAPCPLAAGTGRRAHRPGAGGPCLPRLRQLRRVWEVPA